MKKNRLHSLWMLLLTCLLTTALSLTTLAAGTDLSSLLGNVDAASLLQMLTGASSGSSSSSSSSASSSSAAAESGVGLLLDLLGVSDRTMKDCKVAAIKDQTYTGSAITPTPVVTWNGTRLKKGTDYTASYSNNTKIGTARITLKGKGNYTGTKTVSFKIVRASSGSASSKKGSSKASSGSASKHFTVKLGTNSYTYNGKNRKPTVQVTVRGKSIPKADYTVTYKSNKSVGNATVTVRGKGDYKGYSGEAAFKITLKKTSLQGASSTGEGQITCKWNADSQADGYQIAYATNKTFKNGKTTKVTGGSKKTAVLERLTSGKQYYVRIRSYKKVGSGNWYSEWSAARSVKVK